MRMVAIPIPTAGVFIGLLASAAAGQPAPPEAPTQPAATRPATTQPATQPAGDAIPAIVRQVEGTVVYEVPEQPDTWRPVRVGDRLMPGTRIRTLFRSSVVFTFSDTTVVQINPLTSTRINTAQRTPSDERIRIDLQYGEVRAGVAERQVRTDVTFHSPNATLARRGTEGIQFYSERATGRFRIALAEEGLLEALHRLSQQRRNVQRRQYVTNAMVAWIRTVRFDRLVSPNPQAAMTASELEFVVDHGSGRSVVGPGEGAAIRDILGGNVGSTSVSKVAPRMLPPIPPSFFHPQGNFGLGGATPLDSFIDIENATGRRAASAPRASRATRMSRDRARFRGIGRSRVRFP